MRRLSETLRTGLAGTVREARGTMARLPLRWRLALSSFGLFAVLLGAVGVLITVVEERAMLINQAIVLREEAAFTLNDDTASGLVLAPISTAPPATATLSPAALAHAQSLVARLGAVNVRARLLAPNGTVLVAAEATTIPPAPQDTPRRFVAPDVTAAPADVARALADAPDPATYSLVTPLNHRRQLLILAPLVEGQHTVALLQLSTPTIPIDRTIANTRFTLTVGALAALLVAALLTLPLMRAALRPLEAIERASEHIAGGALSLRLEEPPTQDEIGRLARSFNSMVAQLERSFARQKQFVADVSHELRTPLTALGGGLEMLLLGADRGDVEVSRRLMRGMYAEVERMNRLVADLLTLAQLDDGLARLRLAPVDVGALLDGLRQQALQLAKGQQIEVNVLGTIPPALVDSDRLRQVLLIILDNALKHTPPDGRITLTASAPAAGGVTIEARDTGDGVAPEVLPHVFERFYRADPSRARASQRAGGTGLGLAIARGLIEAHGGTIAIASVLGQGATVTIHLPAAPASLPTPPSHDEIATSAAERAASEPAR